MSNTLERDNTTKPKVEIPPHAPAHLVDVDLYALPDDNIDPQIAWKRLGMFDKGPLVYSPSNGGHWAAAAPESAPLVQHRTRPSGGSILTPPATTTVRETRMEHSL
jgi:hypothetical protein